MERTSLSNELLRQFGCYLGKITLLEFVQQRKKILSKALESLFHDFISKTYCDDYYYDYWLLAVDGSDIQIATNLKG